LREKSENGGYNWIIRDKFLAFSAPAVKTSDLFELSPEAYATHFSEIGVNCVIRLNKARYDPAPFVERGIVHIDIHISDGACPDEEVLTRFFAVAENAEYRIAIHCLAGLGRTGVLIAAWIIRYSSMTAAEAIAWLRLCRTGSIIGPQQTFLLQNEAKLKNWSDPSIPLQVITTEGEKEQGHNLMAIKRERGSTAN
jgi:cell division cycle 14